VLRVRFRLKRFHTFLQFKFVLYGAIAAWSASEWER
jgi:hypothetical protein